MKTVIRFQNLLINNYLLKIQIKLNIYQKLVKINKVVIRK